MENKFKVGNVILYRGQKYEITAIRLCGDNIWYDVKALEPYTDDELKTGIGPGGVKDMKLLSAYERPKTLEDIKNEKVMSIREWEPGIYVVQTEMALRTLKEKVRNGEINSGFNAFVPDYIKELNEKSKTTDGREEILKRLWGDDWNKHEWGK